MMTCLLVTRNDVLLSLRACKDVTVRFDSSAAGCNMAAVSSILLQLTSLQ